MRYSEPLGAAGLAVIQCTIHTPLWLWCISLPSSLTRSPGSSDSRHLPVVEQDVTSQTCPENKAKAAEWANSSKKRFPSCLLRAGSHVFHPPSFSVMTEINDPQLSRASSLTLPFFCRSSHKKRKNGAKTRLMPHVLRWWKRKVEKASTSHRARRKESWADSNWSVCEPLVRPEDQRSWLVFRLCEDQQVS